MIIKNKITEGKIMVKPFLKWAGGKGQLLNEIDNRLPVELKEGKIKKFVEPFIGSGAVLFHVYEKYNIDKFYIYDINPELINVYKSIKYSVDKLIFFLQSKESEFLPLEQENRKIMYYELREKFNNDLANINFYEVNEQNIERASEFIFFNRTCFNGLFRVNKKGFFNVPMGVYKRPKICDIENLKEVHEVLQKVEIHLGDYKSCENIVDAETFVYFDPPYRPLNQTSAFTSYSKYDFTDENQVELANFFFLLNDKNAKLMLSNSDPHNIDENDNFFEELYEKEGIEIESVRASRMINSKGSGRGKISELLIRNYKI